MILDDLPAPYVPMPQDRLMARRAALLEEIGRPQGARPALRHRPARLVLSAAVVTAGTMAWLGVSWFTEGGPAYASWTPIAQHLDANAVRGQAASCLSRLDGMREAPDTSVMSPVLAERRGVFTAVLIGGPKVIGVCLNGAASWMAGYTESPALSPGAKLSLTGDGGKTDAPDAARYVYGRAVSGITGVVVTTADGRAVTATVSSGYFFAWWPSGASPRHITATNASGVQVASLTPPPVPIP